MTEDRPRLKFSLPVTVHLTLHGTDAVSLAVWAESAKGPDDWRIEGGMHHNTKPELLAAFHGQKPGTLQAPKAGQYARLDGGLPVADGHPGTLEVVDGAKTLTIAGPWGHARYSGHRYNYRSAWLDLQPEDSDPHLAAILPKKLHLGSSGGNCAGGIGTTCCPDNNISQTLNVVFSNATGSCTCFPPSTTLTWNGTNAWTNPNITGCSQSFDLTLSCTGGSLWNLESNGLENTANASSGTCSPFVQTFSAFVSNNPTVCTGQVDVSVTG